MNEYVNYLFSIFYLVPKMLEHYGMLKFDKSYPIHLTEASTLPPKLTHHTDKEIDNKNLFQLHSIKREGVKIKARVKTIFVRSKRIRIISTFTAWASPCKWAEIWWSQFSLASILCSANFLSFSSGDFISEHWIFRVNWRTALEFINTGTKLRRKRKKVQIIYNKRIERAILEKKKWKKAFKEEIGWEENSNVKRPS